MINCIVAFTNTGIVGDSKTNDLLWHLPDDMKRFKNLTMGHAVLMDKEAYERIPEKFRPMPGRANMVCTREKNPARPHLGTDPSRDCLVYCETVAQGIKTYRTVKERFPTKKMELFIAGWITIYEQAFNHCDRFHVTLVDEGIHGIEDGPNRVRFPIQRLTDGIKAGIFEVTQDESLHGVRYMTIERRPRGFFQALLYRLFS